MEEWERRWSEVGPAAYLLWDTMRVFEQREQEYLRRVAWYGLGVGTANPWPRYHWHEYWLELRIDLEFELSVWTSSDASRHYGADGALTILSQAQLTEFATIIVRRVHGNLAKWCCNRRRRAQWVHVQPAIIDLAGLYCQTA